MTAGPGASSVGSGVGVSSVGSGVGSSVVGSGVVDSALVAAELALEVAAASDAPAPESAAPQAASTGGINAAQATSSVALRLRSSVGFLVRIVLPRRFRTPVPRSCERRGKAALRRSVRQSAA